MDDELLLILWNEELQIDIIIDGAIILKEELLHIDCIYLLQYLADIFYLHLQFNLVLGLQDFLVRFDESNLFRLLQRTQLAWAEDLLKIFNLALPALTK